jgi:hypothetical protein
MAQGDAALRAVFAFDSVELGETISLSDIHRAIQDVAGVVSVDVDELRFMSQPSGTLEPRLLLAPDELVWVADAADIAVARAGDARGLES